MISKHNYTPAQAYQVLMSRLDIKIPKLASRIREIVDAGIVEQQSQQASGRRKSRQYWKSRPLNEYEVLQVALAALRTYFIDLPCCIHAADEEFARIRDLNSSTQGANQVLIASSVAAPGAISIEVIPETAHVSQSSSIHAIIDLKPPTTAELDEQQANIKKLADLFDFN